MTTKAEIKLHMGLKSYAYKTSGVASCSEASHTYTMSAVSFKPRVTVADIGSWIVGTNSIWVTISFTNGAFIYICEIED